MALESDLKSVLEREQLCLEDQPIYDANNTVAAVEALVRWQRSTGESVGPRCLYRVGLLRTDRPLDRAGQRSSDGKRQDFPGADHTLDDDIASAGNGGDPPVTSMASGGDDQINQPGACGRRDG